jgi:phospholipase/carboxylesterase
MATSNLYYKTAPLDRKVSDKSPLMVLLHGRGSDENDLLELAPYFPPRIVMASVRAPYRYKFGGYTWFDLDEKFNPDPDQILRTCDELDRSVDEIAYKYSADPGKIFLFGFSMGAMISLSMSLLKPERFKGIIAHSGILIEHERLKYRWENISGISYFIAHGKNDPIVPVGFGREACARLEKSKASVIYREYPIQHTISDESLGDILQWLDQNL